MKTMIVTYAGRPVNVDQAVLRPDLDMNDAQRLQILKHRMSFGIAIIFSELDRVGRAATEAEAATALFLDVLRDMPSPDPDQTPDNIEDIE